jgi:transcriptional regulator with XRE-family HTH domain
MTTELEHDLGARIREARKSAGYRNVEQLSVRLNVASATLSRWERGKSEPTISRLREIAALTGRPLSYFFGNEPT